MRLLELTLPTCEENLALDEALLDQAEAGDCSSEILRLWEPDRPMVVVGRSSRLAEEVNAEECRRRGIPVLRRSSGGASIVTGPGCLMYAVVLSLQERAALRMIEQAHRFVLDRIGAALRPYVAGVACRGTSDLVLDGTDKCPMDNTCTSEAGEPATALGSALTNPKTTKRVPADRKTGEPATALESALTDPKTTKKVPHGWKTTGSAVVLGSAPRTYPKTTKKAPHGRKRTGSAVVLESALKVSGNSVRVKRNWLLYHGTLLYNFPIELVEACLPMPPREPAYRGRRPHLRFVANLPISRDDLRTALITGWQANEPLGDWPRELTARLVAERYGLASWHAEALRARRGGGVPGDASKRPATATFTLSDHPS